VVGLSYTPNEPEPEPRLEPRGSPGFDIDTLTNPDNVIDYHRDVFPRVAHRNKHQPKIRNQDILAFTTEILIDHLVSLKLTSSELIIAQMPETMKAVGT
jgi:hypothetical protein